MGKVYTIKKINESSIGADIWERIPAAAIETTPWDENGYRPKSEARAFYTEKAFHVQLKSFEKEIKAVYRNMNDDVYKDSCLEFFLNPNPEGDTGYMNFEINPVGALLLGLGRERNGRKLLNVDFRGIFDIKTSVNEENLKNYTGPFWSVEFTIPYEFIRGIYGPLEFESGWKMKGNFYKCGDETVYPHYLCWNNILRSDPDFHVPEYFGTLILK